MFLRIPSARSARLARPLVLVLGCFFFSGFGLVPALTAEMPHVSWQVIYVGNQRIGYGRSEWQRIEQDSRNLIRTSDEVHLKVKRFGDDFESHVTTEFVDEPDGSMVSFVFEFSDDPKRLTRVTGRVEAGRLRVTTEIGREKRTSFPAFSSRTRSPAYESFLFRNSLRQIGDHETFEVFRPELSRSGKMTVSAMRHARTRLLDGSEQELLEVHTVDPLLPTVRSFLDSDGQLIKMETDFLGKIMTTYRVSEQIAVQQLAGAELDQAGASLIPLDRGLGRTERLREVRFFIRSSNGRILDQIPEGLGQKVLSRDNQTVEVLVQREQAPGRVLSRSGADPKFLEATQYLNTNDLLVRQHARRAVSVPTDPWKTCLLSERYVFKKMESKNFSSALATASDVARSMEGDCTEHAMLLAAILRVHGIPARVASGLVYMEQKRLPYMAGHMWTEALVGDRWVSLDATRGRGGIDPCYLKLADSALADEGAFPAAMLLPLLSWTNQVEIGISGDR